jgi:hypothetical protein
VVSVSSRIYAVARELDESMIALISHPECRPGSWRWELLRWVTKTHFEQIYRGRRII